MLKQVKLQQKRIGDYQKFTEPELMVEIKKLAQELRGKKIIHISATSREGGGGVAEILHALIPLMEDLGIDVSWLTIEPPADFFKVTNKIHNSLQGQKIKLSQEEKDFYLSESEKMASDAEKLNADLYVIHDPQPFAIAHFFKRIKPFILRIHPDISSPDLDTWQFLFSYFGHYKKIILSTHKFVNKDFDKNKVVIFPPAIDPLDSKNVPMKDEHARMILTQLGINPTKPIISQVSRLDPFKDPLGVIRAFYLARKKIYDLQLILLAQDLADDNPYSRKMFNEIKKYTEKNPRIFLFYDPHKIEYGNDTLVNAVQTASDVIIQKSLREGFGLTVTEAMWKGKAVIGGRAGGIKIQIRDGYNGYMVSTPEHCAARIIEFVNNKKLRDTLGCRAKESVAQNFLLPRLLRDHLETYKQTICERKEG